MTRCEDIENEDENFNTIEYYMPVTFIGEVEVPLMQKTEWGKTIMIFQTISEAEECIEVLKQKRKMRNLISLQTKIVTYRRCEG